MGLFNFPNEMLERTLHFLSLQDLQSVSWTCKRLQGIVLDPKFVRAHLQSRLGKIPRNAPIFDRDHQIRPLSGYRYLDECMRLRLSLAYSFRPIAFPFSVYNLGTSRRLFVCNQKDFVYLWNGREWWTLQNRTASQGIRRCVHPLRNYDYVEPLLVGRIVVCRNRFSRQMIVWGVGRVPRLLARFQGVEPPNHIFLLRDGRTLALVTPGRWLLFSLKGWSCVTGAFSVPVRSAASVCWKGRPALAVAGKNKVWILSLKGDGRLHRVHCYGANKQVTGLTWDRERDRLIVSRGRRVHVVDCEVGREVGFCKLPRSYLEHKIYPLPGSLLLIWNRGSQALLFVDRRCAGEIFLRRDQPIEALHLWRGRGEWRLFASGPYGGQPQILTL